MKHLLACTTAAIAVATAAAAGESPYTGPGSNPAALDAQRACGPQVNEANRVLASLPSGDSRRPEIVRQLQYARSAMHQGELDQCLAYVQRAREIEGYAGGAHAAAQAPYARPYSPYHAPVPYGAPGYTGPYRPGYPAPYGGYAPGYVTPYGGYAPGYGVPAGGSGAPW